ncbi:MAG: PQQ-binding-like beta-propeller repeat protein [Phycisphaerales bacterium]|nr:PQQ-binding-like beta-propeller repeat protein [Phycisphaerales bacterium]
MIDRPLANRFRIPAANSWGFVGLRATFLPGVSGIAHRHRRRSGIGLLLLVWIYSSPHSVLAQNNDEDDDNDAPKPLVLQPIVGGMDDRDDLESLEGIQPAIDRDAESWLRRAEDAANREDWKLVADTLERVVRDHGSTLVQAPDGTYRSAIEMAQAQIASLPPEGLEAYRILFDPTAKRLLHLAQENHDLNPLREVARVYPMTSQGPEALDLLTVGLLDSLNPGEALAFLNRLDRLSQSRVSKTEIRLRIAVAAALLGQRDRSLKILAATTSDGAGIAARIAAIRAFVESDGADGLMRSHFSGAWSSRLGPTSVGIAEALSPLVQSNSANVAVLPSKEKADPKAFRDVAIEQGRPPVWRVVSDGERLFVSCPAGIVALDSSTFDVLWQALQTTQPIDPRIAEHRQIVRGFGVIIQEMDEQSLLDDYTTTSLFREYRGAVTAANGLVFSIDQEKGLAERNPSRDGVLVGQQSAEGELFAGGNTLMAYEAETGRLLWECGRRGPRGHPLTDVHFYCTPIAYGDNLLVTFVRNGDIYLGELNRDGDVIREIAIGTGRSAFFPMYGVLEPTIANGSVYVPSGAGLLTALYEHDLSLRWLTRYERINQSPGLGFDRPGALINSVVTTPTDEWLSTPPIQAGGCVLLAPQDANALLAFDVETGKQLWSRPRGSDRYVVGATDDIVVIAGKSVTALRVADGTEVWSVQRVPGTDAEALHLSGRPLMFEDRVLAPTLDGLIALDLTTGKAIGDRVGEGLTLGNLCAFDGALYSIGNTKISRYPDPVQAQDIALERLKRDPHDIQALQRLAWLAALRSDWTTSLDWLDRADSAIEAMRSERGGRDDGERSSLAESSDRVSHYRVNVLISMADEGDEETRSIQLKKAYAAARMPVDRAVAGLALASHEFAEGRETEAGALCVQLLVQSRGRPLRIDDNWRIQDSLEIGRRLRQFYHRSSTEARAAIEANLDIAINSFVEAGDYPAIIRLADALSFMPLGASLDLKIAEHELNDGLIESSIHHLNRVIARTDDVGARQSAMVRLLRLCVDPPESVEQDGATARRLLLAFADADRRLGLASFDGFDSGTEAKTLGDFIAWCESRLPPASNERVPGILRDADQLALVTEAYVSSVDDDETTRDVSSFWDPANPYRLSASVVPARISNQYRGIASDAVDLNSNRWVHDPEPVATAQPIDAEDGGPRHMVVDGRVAVLVGPSQVEAIGLETGRAIWTPIPLTRNLGPLPNPPAVSCDGIAIVATDPNTIVAAAMRDGAAPLWRRTFPDRQLGTMRIVDSRLICLDESAQRAAVIEVETGLLLREYEVPVGGVGGTAASESVDDVFADADPESNVRMFAICGSYVLRGQTSKVIARLATTGEVAWELDVEGGVKGISELDDAHAAVYHGSNNVMIVNPANGHVVRSIVALGYEIPPQDAVIDRPLGSPSPCFLMFTKRDDLAVEYVLVSYALDGDGERDSWHKELGGHATISRQMLRASSEYVAVVTNTTKEVPGGLDAMGRKRQMIDRETAPVLTMLRKSDGRRLSPRPYTFYEGRLGGDPQEYELGANTGVNARPPFNRSREVRDVIILDRRIVAFAPEGYYVLADKAEAEAIQDGSSTTGGKDVP